MEECAQKFDKRIKFPKIRYVLQEVGTKSRIHTFRMQECVENYEKTPNVDNSSLDPMLQSHLLPAFSGISFSLEAVSTVLL